MNALPPGSADRSVFVAAAAGELAAGVRPMFGPLLPEGWRLADTVEGASVILSIDVPVTDELLRRAGPQLEAVGVVESAVTTVAPTAARVLPLRRLSRFVVAEFTVLLILALARRLLPVAARTAAQQWAPGRGTPTQVGPSAYVFNWVGMEPLGVLFGKTVGIVGYGHIGGAVADLLRPFGVRLLYSRRTRLPPDEERRRGLSWRSLDELLAESDVVTLHQRLVLGEGGTENQIGRRELALMKPSALLVNTARGRLVDEAALAEALREGRLAGAALDVTAWEPPKPDNPLLPLAGDRLILTAHVAGGSLSDWWRVVADDLFSQLEPARTA